MQLKRFYTFLFLSLVSLETGLSFPSYALTTRIKDIVQFQGVRDNQLIGYGLVIGLKGTGDNVANAVFTQESLISMLERLGINTRGNPNAVKPRNIAAVMVTATLPPFAQPGNTIDVAISAIGDSKSLQGGILLATPLLGADEQVYAVAQGPLSTGGFEASGESESITRGVPTNGQIANGALVERSINHSLNGRSDFKLSLRNPDFTTARRIAEAINAYTKTSTAEALNPATVQVNLPAYYKESIVAFMTSIEQLKIQPDQVARIIIDQESGTIVMGENVRISTVAIAQGNLTIKVTETPQVSQPNAFSTGGTTQVVNRTNITINENNSKLALVPEGVSLGEIVGSLNTLGVGPRDLITILQSIKAAGALQADIEII